VKCKNIKGIDEPMGLTNADKFWYIVKFQGWDLGK
jgi:hypothetical protein